MSFYYAPVSSKIKQSTGSDLNLSKKKINKNLISNNSILNNHNFEERFQSTIQNPRFDFSNISISNNDGKDNVTNENSNNIQFKLKVSQPGDEYEQEADRIAEQIIKYDSAGSKKVNSDSENKKENKTGYPDNKNDVSIKRKIDNKMGNSVINNVGYPLISSALKEGGQPLDNQTREFMESRFGYDFSNVRIHTDSEKATKSAMSVNALAYTVGNDVVFGKGHYNPITNKGKKLLSHELTHVIQQNSKSILYHNFIIQRSPLTDKLDQEFPKIGKKIVFDILREYGASGPVQPIDKDLINWINSNFKAESDDYWLATRIIKFGAEPFWPDQELVEREKRASSNHWAPESGNIEGKFQIKGKTSVIKAYYFPGTSGKHAMVIGGVHGSEKAGVEVVNILLDMLRQSGSMPYYSVIIVPSIFPDNLSHGSRKTPGKKDPNRQMPKVGDPFKISNNKDSTGDEIEPENLILLDLIERFKPERIAAVHGLVFDEEKKNAPSITTDSRPGFEKEDKKLALDMAKSAFQKGVRVPGNKIGTKDETVTYPTNEVTHEKGVTLGQYGSHPTPTRPAVNIITIETYNNETSDEIKNKKKRNSRKIELESLASVLKDIFLK